MLSSRSLVLGVFSFALFLMACDDSRRGTASDASVGQDSATDVEVPRDAGTMDAGTMDASGADGGSLDDASTDGAAPSDSGAEDSSVMDGGPGGLLPRMGDLAIVEIQGNPVRATDEQAEYFEVLNVSGRVLDLSRVTITHISFVGGEPAASADQHAVGRVLFVEPGQRVLFGSSDGGFFGTNDADYVYPGILISNAETETTRIRLMVPGWDGTEPPKGLDIVDEVIVESRVFGNAVRGQAWQFNPARGTPTAANNDDAANWCTTATAPALEYRGSNFGTPGAPNDCE